MKFPNNLCNVILIITALFSAPVMAGGAVIVHPESGVATLSLKQTKALFLGRSSKFPGGKQAVAVHQAEGSATRRIFADKVLGKSESQLKSYWSKLIFSGKGLPPKVLDDDAAIKNFVANTPGAVGYIDSSMVDSSVTTALTFD